MESTPTELRLDEITEANNKRRRGCSRGRGEASLKGKSKKTTAWSREAKADTSADQDRALDRAP